MAATFVLLLVLKDIFIVKHSEQVLPEVLPETNLFAKPNWIYLLQEMDGMQMSVAMFV